MPCTTNLTPILSSTILISNKFIKRTQDTIIGNAYILAGLRIVFRYLTPGSVTVPAKEKKKQFQVTMILKRLY